MLEGALRAIAAQPSPGVWRSNGPRTGRAAAERAGVARLDVNWRTRHKIILLRRLKHVRRRMTEATERDVTKSMNAGDGGREGDYPGLTQMSGFHSMMNKGSKWIVVLLVSGGMLWRHDEHALWFAIGSVVNGALSKALKYLINEARPPSAAGVKEDPGMPSSHALGFAYLGSYVPLALLLWQGSNIWTILCASGIIMGFAYLSWLRICEGLHTLPQVLVGSALGGVTAILWLMIWKVGVEQAVETSPSLKFLLYLAFASATMFGYTFFFKRWQLGEP